MPIDERLATRAHAASQIIPIKNQRIMNVFYTLLRFQHILNYFFKERTF